MYAGYHKPLSINYYAEAIKSAVPKLKEVNTNPYMIIVIKFHINLIFHHLGHVTNEDNMCKVLQNHPWALAMKGDDQVMAFYNNAIQDDKASIVHEEGRFNE